MKERLWRWFVPHSSNDYTPDLLQRTALLVMGGLVVLTFTMSNLYALMWQQSTWLTGAVLPAVVVEKTNQQRKGEDLPPLVRNSVLDAAAQMKAEDMAKNGYFAHYSPTGVSPWHWFNEAGYRYVHAGENLAVHFTDSKEVVEAWMKSPTHRANIVNRAYREIGVGTAKGQYEGYDTVFVVQMFGTPGQVATADVVAPAAPVAAPETLALAPIPVAKETPVVAGIETTTEAPATQPNQGVPPPVPAPVEPAPLQVAATTVEDHGVVLYSDTITSSTNLLEVPINEALTTPAPTPATEIAMIATSPSSLMQRVYWMLGFFAIIALVLSVAIEWRQQRPVQVFYGVVLLYAMAALFYIHTLVTGGAVVA
ncbi:MAG: CAP domain-containing protein [Candidatus Paceibacteria bacterium]